MIKFYARNCDLKYARQMFEEIPEPNLVSWTSMISSYVHDGQYEVGLRMFCLMCQSALRPNEFGFSLALKACRVMHEFFTGLVIHGRILKSGFESYSFCSSSILGLYVECGDVEDAYKFFNGIPQEDRSEASWNTLIDSYVEMSNANEALKLVNQMMHHGMSPNCFTYSIVLKLCTNMLIPQLGGLIHGQTIKVGFEDDVMVGGALVDVYAKLGILDCACQLFWNLKEKDNIVWCSLLSGFYQIGDAEQGLNFYSLFLSQGNKPDTFTFSIVFSLCSNLVAASLGTQLHCSLVKYGFMVDSFLGSSLINMYGSHGMISDAYRCFHEIRVKDDLCFSAIISNLVLNSNDEMALELFVKMRELGLQPSQSTINCILRLLADLNMLKQGKTLHSHVLKCLGDSDSKLSTENALIEMYAKCGAVDDAKMVFKGMEVQNEYSWTAIMTSLGQVGQFEGVLRLFQDLLGSRSAKPSEFTLVAVVQACAKLEALSQGKEVHGYVVKVGFGSHPFVESSLIAMYSTFKSEIQNAFSVFLLMKELDLVSWSTMLTAWVQNGYYEEALRHFAEFRSSLGFSVDESIVSSCFSACAGLAAMDMGKCFHACVIKTGFEYHLHVSSSIIDMYSKCGSINEAHQLFNEMENHNLVIWTTMISGYAYNGLGRESVQLFSKMKEAGLEPDSIAFIGVLTACSHAGLVTEGWNFFKSMRSDYDLDVTVNHYACMVDLLARNEQVQEAESLIEDAPFHLQSKYLLWKTLLGACNTHRNIEIGNRIAQKMMDLKPKEPSSYVLLSNIYASASMWDNSIECYSPWDMDYFGETETMLFMIWFLAHNIPPLPCAAAQSSEDLN
ncbi:hypothetical protein L484_024605 [Morus notabilis]|uniref:Pentatricopeptide repeat-containing protein n=1 Tax=Morus notabilis TaxID=981085 RepID=W9QRX9_9ROSA|nr:hypothetical protein L484_024605 [Morus notabilis]